MASAAAGALPPSAAREAGCLPYSPLCATFLPAVLRAVDAGGCEREQEAIASLAEVILSGSRGESDAAKKGYERTAAGLASYLDRLYSDHRIPGVRALLVGDEHEDSSTSQEDGGGTTGRGVTVPFAAQLIAVAVWNSPQVRGNGARELPQWFSSIDCVTDIVSDALQSQGSDGVKHLAD